MHDVLKSWYSSIFYIDYGILNTVTTSKTLWKVWHQKAENCNKCCRGGVQLHTVHLLKPQTLNQKPPLKPLLLLKLHCLPSFPFSYTYAMVHALLLLQAPPDLTRPISNLNGDLPLYKETKWEITYSLSELVHHPLERLLPSVHLDDPYPTNDLIHHLDPLVLWSLQ